MIAIQRGFQEALGELPRWVLLALLTVAFSAFYLAQSGNAEQKMKSETDKNTSALVWRIPLLLIAGMVTAKAINLFSFAVADQVDPWLASFDPHGVFMYISIHHIVQLLLVLGLMFIFTRLHAAATFRLLGFNLDEWRFSLKWALLFTLGWTVIQFGAGYFLVRNGLSANPGYPLTWRNLAGSFAFQFFLSGSSEEPLYRGLIMSAMLVGWRPLFRKPERLAIASTAGSTLVFMWDHINFSFSPLSVTHFNLLQQGTLLVFGIFYGWLFWRTQSLLGPILTHGLLNVIIVASGLVLFVALGSQ